jgi:ferrous iron transport protein B
MKSHYNICLAGNPNTGKSSIFNKLTKLRQHTGNWHGKTVRLARGHFRHKGLKFTIDDVPGVYSLFGLSEDEIVARNRIFFGESDLVIVVCNPVTLAKNLNLLFQIMEYNKNVILVVNLIDVAIKNNIILNKPGLMHDLGVPVVFTSAKTNQGIEQLKNMIYKVATGKYKYVIKKIYYPGVSEQKQAIEKELGDLPRKEIISMRVLDADDEFFQLIKNRYDDRNIIKINEIRSRHSGQEKNREAILAQNFAYSEMIVRNNVYYPENILEKTKKTDKILTSPAWGIPIMLLLLFAVFFITIKLANYPSEALMKLFSWMEKHLLNLFTNLGASEKIKGLFVYGAYRTLTQVVAVMLPPMAIFFPLFTFLEDLGYLPRVAFNLDHRFKKAGCCGKQCLTMCMGFGCNAAAVIGTRVINSPRERLLAILTNTFAPCNGRFPLMFTLASCFFASASSKFLNAVIPALLAAAIIVIGIIMTFAVSRVLSKTLLKGVPSTFTLELPQYRKPNILHIAHRSLVDRTLFVLGRAVIVAAPVGFAIWLLANTYVGPRSLLSAAGNFLNPAGKTMGMDGIVLLAFFLALPANEIVLPLIILGYTSGGFIQETGSIFALTETLVNNGWTAFTVIAVLLFSLLHFPCSTTLLTVYRETKSIKWTFAAFIIPTIVAFCVCAALNVIFTIFL